MALPTSYLTSAKNLPAILTALKAAQAPDKFNHAFLESLDFTSSNDRLIIGVLKALGFIDSSGKPLDRYFRYLDQTQSETVLAEGIQEAYKDLFRVNRDAHKMLKLDVQNKFKTLGQGKNSDSVLDKMALTFTALVKNADFESLRLRETSSKGSGSDESHEEQNPNGEKPSNRLLEGHGGAELGGKKLGGLIYNIQIVLPDSRDPAVFDALFLSLRRHLL